MRVILREALSLIVTCALCWLAWLPIDALATPSSWPLGDLLIVAVCIGLIVTWVQGSAGKLVRALRDRSRQ